MKDQSRRRLRPRLPGPPTPDALEREASRATWRLLLPALIRGLDRLIPEVVAAASNAPKAGPILAPSRSGSVAADQDEIAAAVGRARIIAERNLNPAELEAMAERTARAAARHADRVVSMQTKAVVGIDPLRGAPALRGLVEARSKAHARLIVTVPERFFGQIETLTRQALREGVPVADLAGVLRERYYSGLPLETARSNARRLARDQVGKLVSAQTEARHRDLGIRKYTWRTALDERVRGNPSGLYPDSIPSHFDREGVVYEYAKPPEGGPPGHAIQCRCYAEPIIDPPDVERIKAQAEERAAKPTPRASSPTGLGTLKKTALATSQAAAFREARAALGAARKVPKPPLAPPPLFGASRKATHLSGEFDASGNLIGFHGTHNSEALAAKMASRLQFMERESAQRMRTAQASFFRPIAMTDPKAAALIERTNESRRYWEAVNAGQKAEEKRLGRALTYDERRAHWAKYPPPPRHAGPWPPPWEPGFEG